MKQSTEEYLDTLACLLVAVLIIVVPIGFLIWGMMQ